MAINTWPCRKAIIVISNVIDGDFPECGPSKASTRLMKEELIYFGTEEGGRNVVVEEVSEGSDAVICR
jgi:hypothetical protein